MIFRELAPKDAGEVAKLEAVLFAGDNPWPRDVVAGQIAQPHTFYLGAFDEHTEDADGEPEMAGYAALAMLGPRDDPEFEVHTIGVAPSYQGRGLGRALMEQLTHTADLLDGPMFLEVRTDNHAAIALYERFGFFTLATRKQYYQASGKDAYSMMRRRKTERDSGAGRNT
ncbi:ribosomal-protein-alanine N-acetyltransferase [Corynebacterium sp. BCW_4722]|nr:ribosomal-protein-alanine N-acetyltransferase [Corynebacterium sp. BCW_4722]